MAEYLFDLKLATSIRVKAPSEALARYWLSEHLCAAGANFGEWIEGPGIGEPILGEASIDGPAKLIEVDGEAV